jgi:DNA-binding HxlR family transcriptional regulator
VRYAACVRPYGQFCALAKALDAVGDRWSLLIVRELMLQGPCRYTDIHNGVPGIATNLLAERLRDLEEVGVIRREDAPPPVATTLYHLTDRGHDLDPVIRALGIWGSPMLATAPDDDVFQTHWLKYPLEIRLADHEPDHPPATIQVRTGDEPLVIDVASGTVRTRPGTEDSPDAVIEGPHRLVLGLLAGRLTLAQARRGGLRFQGDHAILGRVQPSTTIA